MTWIKTVDESEWDAELNSLRPKITDPTTGQVDNIMLSLIHI